MNAFQIIAIVSSGVVFFIVIDLIRRGRLKERYSLIWLLAAAVMVIFSIWRPLLHFVAKILGIAYPPSFLFVLLIGFLVFLLLHFSSVISALSEKEQPSRTGGRNTQGENEECGEHNHLRKG